MSRMSHVSCVSHMSCVFRMSCVSCMSCVSHVSCVSCVFCMSCVSYVSCVYHVSCMLHVSCMSHVFHVSCISLVPVWKIEGSWFPSWGVHPADSGVILARLGDHMWCWGWCLSLRLISDLCACGSRGRGSESLPPQCSACGRPIPTLCQQPRLLRVAPTWGLSGPAMATWFLAQSGLPGQPHLAWLPALAVQLPRWQRPLGTVSPELCPSCSVAGAGDVGCGPAAVQASGAPVKAEPLPEFS